MQGGKALIAEFAGATECVIMNQPDQQFVYEEPLTEPSLKARDTLLTTFMWVVYAYFWLPMISFGAWLLGIDFAMEAMVEAGGLVGLIEIIRWYGVIALFLLLIIVGWSTLQRVRFHNKDRRKPVDSVPDEDFLKLSGLDADQFALLRSANRVQVDINEAGETVGVHSRTN